MKIVKSLNSGGERSDGLTEAQLGNMRAIHEDPVAYAEWRIGVGLSRPSEGRLSAVMSQRIASMAAGLGKELRAAKRPIERWMPEPARMLTPEELGAQYAANPIGVSEAIRAQNAERIKGVA